MKKLLKKLNLYFIFYKFYIPIKKLLYNNKYKVHYSNFVERLKDSKTKRKIIYVGIPTHNNLGDQAQYYCIKKYIEDNYQQFTVIEVIDDIVFMNFKNTIKMIKKNLNDNDMFVFQSGYRTTDVSNFGGEYAHQMILKNFKNKVIVFPQTVNFQNKNEMKKSMLAYYANNNYLFMARDKVSYNKATRMYDKNRVILYPDIVTSLIGNFENFNEKRDGILLCLRNDSEKLYSKEMYDELISKLKYISQKIAVTDTNSSCDFEFNKNKVESELETKINQFAKYKLIITDRYHGTIFSLIANTKVIVLNSTDHKLSSGVDWFKGIYDGNYYLAPTLEHALNKAKELYFKDEVVSNKSYFEEQYYSKLRQRVEEI